MSSHKETDIEFESTENTVNDMLMLMFMMKVNEGFFWTHVSISASVNQYIIEYFAYKVMTITGYKTLRNIIMGSP